MVLSPGNTQLIFYDCTILICFQQKWTDIFSDSVTDLPTRAFVLPDCVLDLPDADLCCQIVSLTYQLVHLSCQTVSLTCQMRIYAAR